MKRAFYILLILFIAAVGYGFYHTAQVLEEARRTERSLMDEVLEKKRVLIDAAIEETRSFPEGSKIVEDAVEILESERDRIEPGDHFYQALGDIETVGAYYGITMKKLDHGHYEDAMTRYLDVHARVEKLSTTIPGKWLVKWGGVR